MEQIKTESMTETDTMLMTADGVPKRMNERQLAHLAGAFDGLGNIRIEFNKRENGDISYEVVPFVQLRAVKENDPLFGKFLDYCTREGVEETTRSKSNIQEKIILVVRDRENIVSFLDPLMPYLVTQWEPARVMVHTVIPMMEKGKHRTEDGIVTLAKINDEFREYSRRRHSSSQVKYTEEYFREEFSLA